MLIGLSFQNMVIAAVGIFFLFLWLILYFAGLTYYEAAGFDQLDSNNFRLKETYGMGLLILTKLRYSFKTKSDRKMRKNLEVLYSEEYADYYLRAYRSEQIALASIVFLFAFIGYFMSGEIMLLAILLVMSGVIYFYYGKAAEDDIKKRSQELMHDFSEVVSKLALLTNAGSTLQEAWREVSLNGNSILYQEMQLSVDDINNGINLADALYKFGSKSMVPEIKKFVSVVIQSLNKGNSDLAAMLLNQSKEIWNMKKQMVLREGEKAADKLLFPMIVMFVGIMIMIVVPIFANIGL